MPWGSVYEEASSDEGCGHTPCLARLLKGDKPL